MNDSDGCAGCGLMVVLVLVLAFFWIRDTDRKIQREGKEYADSVAAEAAAAKTRIALSEIDLEDLALRPSAGGYRLTGRLQNRSTLYTLTTLELVVKILDCTAPARCETVGEETPVLHANVPPGQTRGLDKPLYFLDLPAPRGRFTFTYKVVSISGR